MLKNIRVRIYPTIWGKRAPNYFKHLYFMNNSFIRLENLYEFTALYVWYTREKFKILRKF